ncbi:MAG: hypothetical protein ABI574_07175 [Burkholderiales bacterium]
MQHLSTTIYTLVALASAGFATLQPHELGLVEQSSIEIAYSGLPSLDQPFAAAAARDQGGLPWTP